MQNSLAVFGAIILFVVFVVGGTVGYIAWYRQAAPAMQDAERDVYENTQSFVHGKIDQLSKMKREYEGTEDDVVRKAIRNEALIAADTIDRVKLPLSLRKWLSQLETK